MLRKLRLAPLALIPVAALSPAASESQANENVVETVFVLAERQPYRGDFPTLETPQVDLTLDEALLRRAGALDLNQALDLSASAVRQNNFGGLWNAFAVRGFVGDENLPSNYLVNGFNAGRGFGGPRDLSGIEAVEVLKGPRAALYGRGEPGGTVNLVTKRPRFETGGSLRLSAGRFETYRADGDYEFQLSDDAALRLIGFYEDAESFRDTVETERYGFMPSLAWRLGETTEAVYDLELSRQKIPFDRGVVALNNQLGAIPERRFLGEPGDGPMTAEVVGHQFELRQSLAGGWSARLGFNYRDTSLDGFSTEAELSGSRQGVGADGRTLTRQRRSRDYDATYEVFRAELAGRFETAGLTHQVIIGADRDEFDNDLVMLRARAPSLASNPSLEQLQAIDILNPVYGQFPLPVPGPLTDRLETQKSTGVFFQDQVTLSNRLDLRFGGRYDDYEQSLDNRRAGSSTGSKTTRFSPQLGAVYQLSETASVYAAYGENFRPLSGTDREGRGFDPNQSNSLEVGVKAALLDGALNATLTLFRVEQDRILVVDDPSAFTLAALGKAESEGLELDVSGSPVEGLSLWLSYAYVDAKTRNAFNDPNFGREIPAGNRLLNVPKHQANLQLARLLTIAGRPLELGGGLLYVGERLGYFGTDFELPDYTVLRAFAAYNLNPKLALRLELDNLFDETYYTNSFSDLWVQPGAPISWRVSMELQL